MWTTDDSIPNREFRVNLSYCWSLFVTVTGDIYYDHGGKNLVGKWARNAANSTPVLNVPESCTGLFVDRNNDLYCTSWNAHTVLKLSLQDHISVSIILAGTGSAGLHPSMLNNPRGVFVDVNLNLYEPMHVSHDRTCSTFHVRSCSYLHIW